MKHPSAMTPEERRAAFVATAGERKQKSRPQKRRSRIKPKSEKQEVLDRRWQFIRACFLICQSRQGGYQCQECGTFYENPKDLQLHHIVRRGKGGDYTPANAILLGSGPGTCQCHEHEDGNLLEWSGGRVS